MNNLKICKKCSEFNSEEIMRLCNEKGVKLSFGCIGCCRKNNTDAAIRIKSDGVVEEFKDEQTLYSKIKNTDIKKKDGRRGINMWKKVLIGAVVIALITGIMIFFMPVPGSANDMSKFNRDFTVQEQEIIKSNIMTMDQVKKSDGKNGHKAYIVIKNTVFDVSGIFKNGSHHGINAGGDVTELFLKSSHGLKTYKKLPVIGSVR